MALDMEKRKLGVGGSELAEILGMNPWRGPWHFWARHHDMMAPVEQTPRMEYGKIVERSILQMAARQLPDLVCQPNGAFKHSDVLGLEEDADEETFQSEHHPLCLATPDGWWLPLREGAILRPGTWAVAMAEAKNVDLHMGKDWSRPDEKPDGIPQYVFCQVQWGMEATSLEKCIVAASIGGHPPRLYEIPFDPEFFSLAYGVVNEFWEKYILTGEPPPVDPKDSRAQSWLKEFYRDQKGEELLTLTGAIERRARAAVERRERAKAAIQAWKKDQDVAEAQLRDIIRELPGVEGPGWKATNKQAKAGKKTDWKAVAEKLLPLCKDPDALLKQHTQTKAGNRSLLTKLEVADGE